MGGRGGEVDGGEEEEGGGKEEEPFGGGGLVRVSGRPVGSTGARWSGV